MSSGRSQAGFTYIALLLAVALIGSTLALTGQSWQLARQREQERELLFVGGQIRDALASYARSGAVMGHYPKQLEELLEDPRAPGLMRHLRRIPRDPLSGEADWVEIRDLRGEIIGVHSRSAGSPLKRANFPPGMDFFAEARSHADWLFSPVAAGAASVVAEGRDENPPRIGEHETECDPDQCFDSPIGAQ